jgi:glycerol dehydrogenase-like iron-containing ADH family enzyme
MDRSAAELHGLQVAFATPICLFYLLEAGCTEYKPEEIRSFMLERLMPTTLSEMKISAEQFIESIHQGLSIMEKRGRYSVLKHLDVDDNSLRSVMADLQY